MSELRQQPLEIRVDVIFWKEKGEFVGHCLQFDIASVGDTLAEAEEQMKKLIVAHVNYVSKHDNWDYLYRPAPPEIWLRFSEGMRKTKRPRWTPRPLTTAVEWMTDQALISTHFSFA